MTTDPLDLDTLDALASAATEGPWEAVTSEATMTDRSEWRIGDRQQPQVFRSQMRSADAEFIAASRAALPALIAEMRRLRDLLGEVPPPFVWEPTTFDEAVKALGGARGALVRVITERNALRAAVDGVRSLHEREVIAVHEGHGEEAWCPVCQQHWPCDTIHTLDTHLPDDTKEA